jgi:hypothetical protein
VRASANGEREREKREGEQRKGERRREEEQIETERQKNNSSDSQIDRDSDHTKRAHSGPKLRFGPAATACAFISHFTGPAARSC